MVELGFQLWLPPASWAEALGFVHSQGPPPQSSQVKAFLEQVIGSTDQAGAVFHIASATFY